jgi:gamma-glutamylcyclotransferase (GGCT)/AIG2-like uncharacterized protein YtfP
VYGTLKRGCKNNSLLAGQEFISEARTLPRYRLYDTGEHPCLVEDKNQGVSVQGEIWRIDETTRLQLDRFEEVPNRFIPQSIAILGQTSPIMAYFFRGDVRGFKDCGESWSPGM